MSETPEFDINKDEKDSPCDNMHVWRNGRIINDSDNKHCRDISCCCIPGPRGPSGPAGSSKTILFMAAPSIPKDGWLGLGSAGPNFINQSIFIPAGTRI